MPDQGAEVDSAFGGAVRRVATLWAMAGGLVLIAVVVVNVFSVIGAIFNQPFPGDFELTEVGVAIAAFAFLPYCQISGANITADIFTARASARLIAFLTLLGSLVALAFCVILLWRMYLGMLDQKLYNATTAILQIPHWLAFLPILFSLALLALAAVATLLRDATALVRE